MKRNPSHARMPCPCGSDVIYPQCCGRWHEGLADGVGAPTPEALMRSRYSAQAQGDAGVVEFVARLREQGRAQRMHEVSRFVREAGLWYYIDGQAPADADRV